MRKQDLKSRSCNSKVSCRRCAERSAFFPPLELGNGPTICMDQLANSSPCNCPNFFLSFFAFTFLVCCKGFQVPQMTSFKVRFFFFTDAIT